MLAPGQRYPDVAAMNAAVPESEWTEGPDGKPRGPWQAQHIVYLLNPLTMDRYTFPTGTTGGHIAVADLVDKVKWMRRLRGENVYPVVTLSDTFMNTRFGGRQRPHFIIKRWVGLGEDGKTQALPAPTSPTLPPADATEQPPAAEKPKQDPSGLRTVEEPSVAEDLDDSIPSKGSAGKTDHKHKVGSRAPQAGATTKKRAGSRA